MGYYQFKGKIGSFTQKLEGEVSVVFKKDESTIQYALEVDMVSGENKGEGRFKNIPKSFDVSNKAIIEILRNNLSDTFLIEFNENEQIEKVTIIK